jgi:hypothetical protein
MKREARCLYKLLLAKNGKLFSLKEIIGFFDAYNALQLKANSGMGLPESINHLLWPITKPNYLKWVEKYLVGRGK